MVTTIFTLHSANVTTNACTQRAQLQHAELYAAVHRKKRRRRCNDYTLSCLLLCSAKKDDVDVTIQSQLQALRLSINPKLRQRCCASELGNHNSPAAVQKFSYFLTCKRCDSDALQQYRFLHSNFHNAWDAIP
jgi:hypothetical protein